MSSRLIGISFAVCSALLESFAQVCLKNGATANGGWLAGRYWIVAGLVLFLFEASAWTLALCKIDVSMAYPIGSLSFVGAAVISQMWLKEKVTNMRWFGVLLIISGTIFVGLN
jgi:multidrug transporter EmrE-like cation transporter